MSTFSNPRTKQVISHLTTAVFVASCTFLLTISGIARLSLNDSPALKLLGLEPAHTTMVDVAAIPGSCHEAMAACEDIALKNKGVCAVGLVTKVKSASLDDLADAPLSFFCDEHQGAPLVATIQQVVVLRIIAERINHGEAVSPAKRPAMLALLKAAPRGLESSVHSAIDREMGYPVLAFHPASHLQVMNGLGKAKEDAIAEAKAAAKALSI